MSDPNKHGLTRYVGPKIEREVRKRCGFGCVICGNAFCHYDHFDPEFADAVEHHAAGITLLCGGCHDRKSRKALSNETVAAADKNPFCKRKGFSFGPMDIGVRPPEITIGPLIGRNVRTLVQICGDDVLSIGAPEEEGAPFRLNAFLCDSDGAEVLKIVDNVWQTHTGNWDVEVVGARVSVRRASRDIVLVLRVDPPNKVVIERIHMMHKGVLLDFQEGNPIRVGTGGNVALAASRVEVEDCEYGLVVTPTSIVVGRGGGGRVRFSGVTGDFSGRLPERVLNERAVDLIEEELRRAAYLAELAVRIRPEDLPPSHE